MTQLQSNPFVPAKKEQSRLRLAITGPSGSGKTWSALLVAEVLADLRGGKIAFLDTEGRSARKYASRFKFDVYDLSQNYEPKRYITAIHAAAQFGYAVIVVDSFTHAWNGVGGVLEIVDKAGAKMGGNDFAGWSKGRPAQNNLVDALINANIDIIGTMRTKTDWVLEVDERGKTKPVKKGLAPIQSSDFEYEFDVVLNLDMSHTMAVSKSRCQELVAEEEYRDTVYIATSLHNWLSDGEYVAPRIVERPPVGGQSSTGESGDDKSGDDDDDKQAPAWQDNIEQMKTLISAAVEAGYIERPAKIGDGKAALLQLIGKKDFNEFDTFADAQNAIKAEAEKLQQELNNRNASKSQADEPADEPAAPASSNGTPETLSEKDRDELKKWITANFAGRDFASVCEELETDFAECSTIGFAKNKIIQEAEKNCWAVVVNQISYRKQSNKPYLLFTNEAISEIRWYKGRGELATMLGDDFPNVDKIKILPEGESLILNSNIAVTYEAKGHYNNVVSAIPLESFIPF